MLQAFPTAEVYFGEIDPTHEATIRTNIRENGLDGFDELTTGAVRKKGLGFVATVLKVKWSDEKKFQTKKFYV